MGAKISVIVIDDHPLFREGVVRTLGNDPAIRVAGEGSSADEAVALSARYAPDIALLDISMPGKGIEAARRIIDDQPSVKVVMLTVSEHDDDVMAAMKVGARGYILKGVSGPDLTRVIKSVAEGHSYVTPSLAAKLLTCMSGGDDERSPDVFSELTAREEQILRRVALGKSNKEIGSELRLQEKTVKHYMTNILQKLQVRNRTEAALLATGQRAETT